MLNEGEKTLKTEAGFGDVFVIPEFGRWRQEGQEFKGSFGALSKKKKKKVSTIPPGNE